jgi:tetraacyldisaccharide-1-P 4'-kinase
MWYNQAKFILYDGKNIMHYSFWDMVAITPTNNLKAIKQAYAQKLKLIDQDDGFAFQTLKDAFDAATNSAKDAIAHTDFLPEVNILDNITTNEIVP